MEEDIYDLLDEARNSISSFCIAECKAKCCRSGFLAVNSRVEVDLLTKNNTDKLINSGDIEKVNEERYMMNLGKRQCDQLSPNFMCNVHKDKNRPRLCSDYPLFKVKNYIIPSPACDAVVQDKFKDYFKKMEDMGYKIV